MIVQNADLINFKLALLYRLDSVFTHPSVYRIWKSLPPFIATLRVAELSLSS